ncbi:MAG: ATP-dependent metallopeptidase FtsH/Yme1/Tma family protein [Candidatus Tectomicrobia bacterium]|uniref:ATP-dependent zinc metalloprotease FtsH n=1 Tax=Tectimicrobiota bacterium TaxID=2528274 RepID=A0A933LQ12_UNCTE|nr:ATP-dependent metallopeptidase FtsH/Yme1/Tma family protein [Candidatus Tectomicrobia bacterium]
MDPKQKFSLSYFLIAFFILLVLENYLLAPHVQNLNYSEFKALLKAGNVGEVVITQNYITGTVKPGGLERLLPADKAKNLQEGEHRFRTVKVDDPALTEELEKANVAFSGTVENTWFKNLLSLILPALVFVAIWGFLMKRMGAGGGLISLGKSKAKVYMEKETGITFDDVAGIDEAKAELQEVVDFLQHPARFTQLGGRIPKGVLLVGLPGTGKTLLARAVAGEAGVPFFSMSGSDFVEMFVGLGAARVRDLFAQAQAKAPCIIFIDELDALGKARGANPLGGHDEREQTLNQLLVEMDGFDPRKGVIIMAATNRPEILDPALLRAGRFDRHVLIDKPDIKGREAILKVHAKNVKLAPEVDFRVIAAKTPGFAGADLANIVNEAALLAARHGKEAVEMSDFDEAIDRIVAGLEKKNRVLNPKEKEVVAYHESGHALVASLLPGADPVSKISIIPRGIAALGYTQQLPTEDRYLMMKSELMTRLCVLLGGRVAEEITFTDVSTGAQNDLQRATDIARSMVANYGMSEALGLIAYNKDSDGLLYRNPLGQSKEYSEETAQAIDREVKKILEEAHDKVRKLLCERHESLKVVASRLLEKEVISGEEFKDLITAVGEKK